MINYSVPNDVKIPYRIFVAWQVEIGSVKQEDVDVRYLADHWTISSICVRDEDELLIAKIKFGI